MIQTILVGIIVAAAVALVIRHYWKAFKGKSSGCGCGCSGGCSSCGPCGKDKKECHCDKRN